ncbi:dCTP deaminase domain-containing protein [Pseudanabaena sp. PCC 6802]|uniref:dCTP deaminase domain-containing protein n=1 Tax=Pseudanabaena sp. PCC 6802 TaxID=118173 RepID=UPI000347C266|nr:hypothetical protein [Pseudanabaena sp. PCC 6802]
MLSDVDIKRELGTGILIYPFKESNLKGASYNLTASRLAWCIGNSNSQYNKKSIYNPSNDKIIIPARTTALIETYEAIWVSQNICGTYHSRVGQVSQGTGHIGTTLDPNYIGPSLIAVHNHSDEQVEITPETEPFVTLAFQYVCTKSSVEQHGNSAGRREILMKLGIQLTLDENTFLDEAYLSNKDLLKKRLEECEDYKLIKSNREEKASKNSLKNLYVLLALITGVLIIVDAVLTHYQGLKQLSWYDPVYFLVEKSIEATIVAWIAIFVSRLEKKNS